MKFLRLHIYSRFFRYILSGLAVNTLRLFFTLFTDWIFTHCCLCFFLKILYRSLRAIHLLADRPLFAQVGQTWNMRWSSMYFDRLCWEHLINFGTLFSPLHIIKHRSLGSLWFFNPWFRANFPSVFRLSLNKLQQSWHLMTDHDGMWLVRKSLGEACIGLLICSKK